MSEYLTEQEQVQLIKNWIKQYGLTILAGVAIAVLISSAFRYYQGYRNNILLRASSIYDEMLTDRAQNNTDTAETAANKLLSHYPKTPYAQMAAFLLARDAVLKKDYPSAISQLNWVMDHASNRAIKEIARIRIARINLANQKPDAALETLKQLDDKTFLGMVDEVRGDAYIAMNDLSSAKKAYELALHELPNAEVDRPILQMKYENLAGVQGKV